MAPAPEGYALQPELKRLPLGDRRVVSMGSSGLLESQWQRQRLERDDDEPPVAVKPLVLPIENACKANRLAPLKPDAFAAMIAEGVVPPHALKPRPARPNLGPWSMPRR